MQLLHITSAGRTDTLPFIVGNIRCQLLHSGLLEGRAVLRCSSAQLVTFNATPGRFELVPSSSSTRTAVPVGTTA